MLCGYHQPNLVNYKKSFFSIKFVRKKKGGAIKQTDLRALSTNYNSGCYFGFDSNKLPVKAVYRNGGN